jgi:hypothetical protein
VTNSVAVPTKPDLPHLILAWSLELPLWQRDALRRLFTAGEISAQDVEDLVALAKQDSGIVATGGLSAVPLDQSHLPQVAVNGERVILESITQNQSVNAIPDGHTS